MKITSGIKYYQFADMCHIIGKQPANVAKQNSKSLVETIEKHDFSNYVEKNHSLLPDLTKKNLKTYCDNHEIIYELTY